MPRLRSSLPNYVPPAAWGPALIAVGLAVLTLASWWPAAPAVSAMAVLALGATGATLDRFGGSPSLRPILAVHVVTYAGLYALFIGATLHAATKAGSSVGWVQSLDLAASAMPMTAAAWLAVKTLCQPGRAN